MNKRIDDIEILRAIAVILVVIEHSQYSLVTWQSSLTERLYTYLGGWAGVDLFFVISGFVIAKDLVPRLQQSGDIDTQMKATLIFWVKRFWRLIPSAWLWLGVILALTVGFNDSGAFSTFRANFEGTITAILQVANFHVGHSFGKFDLGINFHYWSLSLEEQFYILLPLLIILSKKWLVPVLISLVVIQCFITRDTALLSMIRAEALLLGVLIAIWRTQVSYSMFRPAILAKSTVARLGLFGLLVICLATIGSDDLHMVGNKYLAVALVSTLMVIIASYNDNLTIRQPFVKKILMWIGSRSYAIYLIHMPAYALTREIWFRISPKGTNFNETFLLEYSITAGILLIVLSEINFRFVETPLRKKGATIAAKMNQPDAAGAIT